MIEQDTTRLLRECDAGVKMGIDSIEDVVDRVSSKNLKKYLNDCKFQHQKLQDEIEQLLDKYKDDGKDPNPITKGMSWMKTNMMLIVDESDEKIADLMTDGCNMGVKSLSRYLNQYPAADSEARSIAKRLISEEEKLAKDIRTYL